MAFLDPKFGSKPEKKSKKNKKPSNLLKEEPK